MMIAKILWITGSSVYIFLATLHLLYTFFTNKFLAKDKNTVEAMKNTHPLLTNRTTMWKAWIGFNGSHSSGGIFLGMSNLLLAVLYFPFLSDSLPLLILTIVTSLFYLFLGIKYWFNIPLSGIAIATTCYIVAFVIILAE
ncbi:MAG TPA: hypothetical protein VK489_15020 [Ferruginibacter sp.]|nr:hypothetical protein [Ferruginibacter sp.]